MLEVHWCSGCDANTGDLLHKVGTEEFKPLEFYHSNSKCLHQRLLSKVS